MRKTKRTGHFLLCLLLNLLLNLEGSIPAWILLVLHFVLDISVIWFVVALAIWILVLVLWMVFTGWAAKCANTPDVPKKNKNPYSVKTTDNENRQ